MLFRSNDRTLRVLTAYAVNLITVNKEQIKRELMQSIKKVVSMPQKEVDKHKIEAEIENLRKKKIKIIDLAAEGAISAGDMKAQNEVYSAQIADFTRRLTEAENASNVQLSEAKRLEEYAKRIDTLLDINPEDDNTLKETLQKAVVYNDGMIDIYLNCVPFGIRLWYKTSGKLDFFAVEVTKFEMANPDVQF